MAQSGIDLQMDWMSVVLLLVAIELRLEYH
jgi:hypothetical protein